ncbi:Y-family DNA polymerase [Pseudoalteromonas xiamenensis]
MALWLYLHFPQLQLDSVFPQVDEVSGQQMESPIVIVAGKRNEVVQANAVAKQIGIKLGMGLGAAAALSRALVVHPYDEQLTKTRLIELADWLYLVSADLALFEPDGIALKVTNMLALYGDITHYWQHIQSHLALCRVEYHYACGYSPLAARLLAKQRSDIVSDDETLLLTLLKQQPLSAAELTHVLHEPLSRLGLRTMHELLAIPLAELGRRFDQGLVQYVGRLLGHFQHPLAYYQPPETFCRTLHLLFELENLDWLVKPLTHLLTQLETFLRVRDKLAYELKLTLTMRDVPDKEVFIAAAEGEYRANAWLKLSTLTLSNVTLEAPLQALTLKVEHMQPRAEEARDLFSAKRKGLTAKALLSILQAKLGKDAVRGVCVTDDPRPEFATQYVAPLSESQTSLDSVLLRPTFLFPTPKPLSQQVVIVHGPERLTTGWWDGQPQVRDYFIARDTQGCWLWIFRTETQRWFVHGMFS